jgi:5-methyltetrahydrofolate--homocysteine methyltransferase
LPEVVDGQTVYPLTPDEFSEQMYQFVTVQGVSIVGGCCGTSPAHIKALVEKLTGVQQLQREVSR